MADTNKASEIIRAATGVDQADYLLMEQNARRYAMTDAEVEEDVLKQLMHHPKVESAMRNGTVGLKMLIDQHTPVESGKSKTFNAKNVLAAVDAPFENDGRYKTAEEKLVSLYKSNPNKIRNAVYRDKDFGDWGSQNLDKLIYAAENYKKPQPKVGMGNKVAGTIFYPRSLEAMEAGRTPGAKDILGDVGEDILMAIPVGAGAAALASKAPRAVKAAQIMAAVTANSMVPLASETYDANVYNPEENLDRSVFQPADVVTGGVTNIVAPYIGGRLLNRGSRMLGLHPMREVVEGAVPRGGSAEAKKVVDSWLSNHNFVMPDKEQQDAIWRETWKRLSESRKRQPDYKQAAQANFDYISGKINESTKKGHENAIKNSNEFSDMHARAKIAAGFFKGDSRYAMAMAKNGKLSEKEFKEIYADAIGKATKIGDDEANELLHRMALNDAPTHIKGSEILKDAAESFGFNRYGSQRHADAGLSMIGSFLPESMDIDPGEKLNDWRDERKKTAKNNYRRGIAAQVLTDIDMAPQGEQSDVDAKWLGEIYANPNIVTGEGIGGTAEFKNWWNTRGVILLGGSGAFPGIKK